MIEHLDSIPALVPKLLLHLLEGGNLSQAATSLAVSQPAASKAIRRAESLLGFALIKRDARPLVLTEEGGLVAQFARQRLEQEAILIRQLRMIRKEGAGVVKIASFGASASTHMLPRLFEIVRRDLPKVSVEISEFNDDEALLALREGRVDFATIVDHEYLDLEIIPIVTDRLVALVHEDDPLALLPAISVADLEASHFILTKGGSEALIRAWFSTSGTPLQFKHTAVQLTSILAMIRSGLGVSIVAELAVPDFHPEIRVLPLTPEYPRRIGLARRSGSFSSHAAQRLWRYLCQHREQLLS